MFLRVNFLQNLDNIGYPSNLRKIAIANGSGNASGQRNDNGTIFNPTDRIVNLRHRSLTVDVDGNSCALPNISPNSMIFEGNIDVFFLIAWAPDDRSRIIRVSGTDPYDNAPGGTTNTMGKME